MRGRGGRTPLRWRRSRWWLLPRWQPQLLLLLRRRSHAREGRPGKVWDEVWDKMWGRVRVVGTALGLCTPWAKARVLSLPRRRLVQQGQVVVLGQRRQRELSLPLLRLRRLRRRQVAKEQRRRPRRGLQMVRACAVCVCLCCLLLPHLVQT